jgi:hypothetical protein
MLTPFASTTQKEHAMSPFQVEAIEKVAAPVRGESKDKRAAAALRIVHATAQSFGPLSLANLEHIMVAFNATRELRHP